MSALMEAASGGRNALIGPLLAHRADPGLKNSDGHTAADLARSRGNAEAVALLAQGP